jgi:hypothetical protein
LLGFSPISSEELAPGSGVGHKDVLTERPRLCGGVEPAFEPLALASMTSEVFDGFSDEPSDGIASAVECSSSLPPLVSSDLEKMEAMVASVSPAVGKASDKTVRKPSPTTGWSMVSVEPSVVALVSPVVEQAPVKTDSIPSSAKGLLRRGFLGSRTASPSSLEVKEVSSLTRTAKERLFNFFSKDGFSDSRVIGQSYNLEGCSAMAFWWFFLRGG